MSNSPSLGADKILSVLHTAIQKNKADADGLEALLNHRNDRFVRFGCNTVLQTTQISHPKVTIRAIVNGATAETSTSDLSPEGLEKSSKQAIELARYSTPKEQPPTLPSADALGTVIHLDSAYNDETASPDPDFGSKALAHGFSSARQHGFDLAGHLTSGIRERAVVNSNGLQRYFCASTANAAMYATKDRASGYSGNINTNRNALTLDRYVDTAIEKCERGLNPTAIAPGEYDVILEPTAVAELMEWMGYIGFTPKSMEAGTSFMHGRINEPVTGKQITIYDDGYCSNGKGIPNPFDREGVIRQKITLIEEGVGRNIVHDTQTARKSGCQSTGHAVTAQEHFDATPAPGNMVLCGGSSTTQDLLSRVEDGLWITSFHYVNGLLEPRRAVMTGLTRHGTFRITNGKLGKGVQNLRFTDSVLEAFQRIDGMTETLEVVPTWWSGLGASVAPSMLIRGLKFTSSTKE